MNDEMFVIKYPNVTFLSIDQGLHLDSLGETSCLYNLWTLEHIAIFEVNVSDICHFIVTEIQCPRLRVLHVKGCPNLTKLLLEVDSVSDLDISQSMPLNSLRHLHVITSSSKLLAKILSQVNKFRGNIINCLDPRFPVTRTPSRWMPDLSPNSSKKCHKPKKNLGRSVRVSCSRNHPCLLRIFLNSSR